MSQVSLRHLPAQVEGQIYQIFLDSFSLHTSPSVTSSFLSDHLSPVERLMLAKRLAISYMLLKGYPHRTVADTLRVSQATVTKVNLSLKAGDGYRQVITKMLKKEQIVAFFDQLEAKITQ